MTLIRPAVSVQFATARTGVPHASVLRTWALRAFDEALPCARADQHGAAGSDIAIRVINAAESRRLNRIWRGKDKPTNVLSFPAGLASAQRPEPSVPFPLGDLAICAPVVAREARVQDKSPHAHWAHMVVHGVLHLLGYDHETDRDAWIMEAREVAILAHFGYANPYA